MAQLRQNNAAGNPINMSVIGLILIDAGYTQEQLVNGLFYLQLMTQIQLLDGNRVKLSTPL